MVQGRVPGSAAHAGEGEVIGGRVPRTGLAAQGLAARVARHVGKALRGGARVVQGGPAAEAGVAPCRGLVAAPALLPIHQQAAIPHRHGALAPYPQDAAVVVQGSCETNKSMSLLKSNLLL